MYRIAVAGNPNSGKTCLFNQLTGSSQRVGNYPGVTVEFVVGNARFGNEKVQVVDLPGTYSLTAYSQEELVARNYLVDQQPDVIVNVVDASNLERNLYLTAQLLELRVPLVIALNMVDVAEKKGHVIDAAGLSAILGVEVVKTVANRSTGMKELKDACLKTIQDKIVSKPLAYTHELGLVLPELESVIAADPEFLGRFPARWIALKLLEDDEVILTALKKHQSEAKRAKIENALARAKAVIHAHSNEDSATAVVEARYGFAGGAAREVTRLSESGKRFLTDNIDRIVCNRFLGPLILAAIVYALFAVVFKCANGEWLPLLHGEWTSPTGLVELIFDALAGLAASHIHSPMLQSLVSDGLIGGVGGVMEFVPLIFFMFLFIAMLEDSGYVARIAFIMDRALRVFGLQGKSVLAMIVSGGLGAGGCAVPGVMAARTMREENDRLLTILAAPFMNCGAKIPVYAMLIGAFFVKAQGAMMFLLWVLSWCFALGSSWLLRKFVVKGEQTPFVMELPVYHLPTFRGVLMDTWHRTFMFIKKAATIILAVNIVMWALMYYPRYDETPMRDALADAEHDLATATRDSRFASIFEADELEKTVEFSLDTEASVPANPGSSDMARQEFFASAESATPTASDAAVSEAFDKYRYRRAEIVARHSENQLLHSFGGRIGTFLQPVSRLAGFGWRENIALLGGFAAKEVVVGTLGTAYSMSAGPDAEREGLSQVLANNPEWNPLRAFAMLVFVMAYAPCIVTVIIIRKETGRWFWAIFSTVYSTLVAFVVAALIYQIGGLF